ncbi:argininosuccinate lyase [Rhizomicrobium electricum]|jgi:argininosuccinate lyase|uniref:Argininosuccinate lyase n=1 Tax=Rhizomicrobium electricum TaxID=480070 RepID=A0ABP3Q3E1_9PROT|nr:argininosuccinate lyase [Rhizomicrobium electricum]NIJ49393.1 argininosuccinate lyase [Rhizomicrobium electricum]
MSTNKMWGGRFEGGPAKIMEEFTPSIGFDQRLAREDIQGSRAHAKMLATQGIISREDLNAIMKGLETIEAEIKAGSFEFKRSLEDIHLNIESRLSELAGPAAGRLHTARSRNDQVATDFRLWVRAACTRADAGLTELQQALFKQAEANLTTIMPGFTHMQSAQPITFAHHCLAYVEMFGRDRLRFADAAKRLNECPLGAAALAGTPYPIDREYTAIQLGFARPMRNSLDAVSSRDFALEYLAAAAIAATHLSKLAAELVQWCSPGFGFVKLSDAFTTGSSIMPQKRNPDAAELIRGKSGRVIGDFVALAAVVKGLVLAYGTDLQEDKERVFDASDALEPSLKVMAGMFADLTVNPVRMRTLANAGYPTATDLADWLVQTLNKPFREAHHITGSIVKRAEDLGVDLDKLPLEEMQKIEPGITADVMKVLSVEASVAARMSYGGTAPDRVREQLFFWREKLK